MHSWAAAALVALAILVSPTMAHSWVEELDVIDPKTGTFTGTPGYCRNNTKQTAPGFSDPLMVHVLPGLGQPTLEERDNTIPALDTTGIFPNDTMCKHTQETQYQSNGNPRLQAAPGDLLALRFQENGHVSLPQNQPGKQSNRGWIYVYGTTQPKFPELFLDIFGQWTTDGTGGDKRGKLLAKQPFDDGYCYQVNGGNISTYRQAKYPHTANQLMGANLWCQNDIALPTDVATGKPYVIYWVWDWPTEPGVDPNLPKGKSEIYTSCIDVDIVAKQGSKRRAKARQAPSPVSSSGLDHLNSAAIPSYLSSLTASPAPAGASPAVSAQASAASPESTITPTAGAQIVANPTNPASNAMTNAGVDSEIEDAVSAAVVAGASKVPLTITVDIVESVISPMTAGAAAVVPASTPASPPTSMAPSATQPASSAVAPASNPAASPAYKAPAASEAASPAPASTPPTASTTPIQAAPSSMPPKKLDINPPVLSGSPTPSTSASPPVFSGTATPVAASPAVAATPVIAAGATKNSTSSMMASGASQNGTMGAKGQCSATTCKSKRQSKIFGKKSGGKRL